MDSCGSWSIKHFLKVMTSSIYWCVQFGCSFIKTQKQNQQSDKRHKNLLQKVPYSALLLLLSLELLWASNWTYNEGILWFISYFSIWIASKPIVWDSSSSITDNSDYRAYQPYTLARPTSIGLVVTP